tara:strand:- start:1315 stop:1461 length:147 start_codon:yes stop_codon:yes gene_type:complete
MQFFTPQELRVLIAVLALLATGLVVKELRDVGGAEMWPEVNQSQKNDV